MKQFTTLLCTLFSCLMAFGQLNVSFVGQFDYDQDLSDVWGYVAPDSTEYAIAGLFNGVSILSLADPANPVEVASIPGEGSVWRDIKTFGTYAYVVTDQGGTTEGLTVIDLSDLPNSVDYFHWTPDIPGLGPLRTCHNLYIDEAGVCYLAGCNINSGGMLFIDVFSDPGNPSFIAAGDNRYSHDVYVRDNLMYSSDIGEGFFSITDVTDKENVVLLGTQTTGAFTTHNAWLSDDGNVLFTTDETGSGPVGSYDVSDPGDIIELDQFRPLETLGTGVVPHNVHVLNDYLIISYYTDGCIIVDASNPDNLIEVGNFDTYIPASTGFQGAWGAYPYLPSGLILVSDIADGIYVLEPNYVRACWLEGDVKDAVTEAVIQGAQVEILTTLVDEPTDANGAFATGVATAGTYTVEVTKFGYEPGVYEVEMVNGEITLLNALLTPLESFALSGVLIDAETGDPIPDGQVVIATEGFEGQTISDASGNFSFDGIVEATYDLLGGKWGYKTGIIESLAIDAGTSAPTVELEPGLQDDYNLDLGWTVEFEGLQGPWERVEPIGVFLGQANYFLAPDVDSDLDFRNSCYVTGNIGDLFAGVFVTGTNRLVSPEFDLTTYVNPAVSYESWFFTVNGNTGGPSIVDLNIFLDNGIEEVQIESISYPGIATAPAWENSTITVADFIEPTENMRIIFEIANSSFSLVSEGGIDFFQVLDQPSSVSSQEIVGLAFDVYPNPSKAGFYLSYQLDQAISSTLTARITNLLGQELASYRLTDNQGFMSLGEHLETGVYLLQIIDENQNVETVKLMKQ